MKKGLHPKIIKIYIIKKNGSSFNLFYKKKEYVSVNKNINLKKYFFL